MSFSLGSFRQLGNEEEIKRAQIYFDDCYMIFKVGLWNDIPETSCSFLKGMRHIILVSIMSKIIVSFPSFAQRCNIPLTSARWPSSPERRVKQLLTGKLKLELIYWNKLQGYKPKWKLIFWSPWNCTGTKNLQKSLARDFRQLKQANTKEASWFANYSGDAMKT